MAQPKILAAVDSMTLVWGVRKEGPAEMLDRARRLLYQLDRDGRQIVVPSIVIAEYLSHIDLSFHAKTIEAMREKFFMPPFDVKAASLAAELFKSGQSGRGNKGTPDARKCLRADSLIVATAKAHGTKAFYSHDKNCRLMAERAKLAAFDLPSHDDELPFPAL
jgi:predicted nucleic acid-binding protein